MAEPATLSSSKPSLMLAGKYDVEVEEVLDQILTSATCTVTNFTHTILFKSQSQSNLSNTLQYLNHHSHSIFFIVDCNRHTSAACTIIGLACAYNLQISISVSMSLYPLLIVLDLVAIIPVVQKQHQFLVTLPLYNFSDGGEDQMKLQGQSQSSNGNFVLELDFEPFNTSFPRPTLKKSIGNGVEFLNGHLSAKLFHGKESMQPLLEFVRLHSYNEKVYSVHFWQ
ncbi:hypothetical protein Ahy_B05g077664 isoform A [Arachis hypogaea]|uniref:sucrose synthase n=1 Tax=Arachis hypogaea TaxID=3818 RepID=A0A444Z5C0_ARAHY|nr:hypothetical protein Ahy_B05g077664 isoform A [Arachis hypogaea]